jgi:peptidoglycan L-alanyl-D-glutamate endopeptidase CwlK
MIRDRDKSHLFPPFAETLLRLEDRLARAHLPFYLFEGLRSHAIQADYWAQGRDRPGDIITWARPGESWHQYGLAGDYVLDGMLDKPGVQWSWDKKSDLDADGRRDWEQMAEIAVMCGLEAGWYWPAKKCDPPHVQCRYGLAIREAQELFALGGLPTVWQAARTFIEDNLWP